MPTGILTGLAAEARIIERLAPPLDPPPLVACSGAQSGRARAAARHLLERGAQALVSFGMAGALSTRLRAGTLLLPGRIIRPGGAPLECSETWRERVLKRAGDSGIAVETGGIAGVDTMLSTDEKKILHERTRAVAVDMESHILATAAAEEGLPFLCIRAVADTSGQRVPACVIGAIGSGGRPRLGKILRGLCTSPGEAADLIRLRRSSGKALRALERIIREAGPVILGGD